MKLIVVFPINFDIMDAPHLIEAARVPFTSFIEEVSPAGVHGAMLHF